MGEVSLGKLNAWADKVRERLDERMNALAESIVDDAKARAPIRKTTAGRKRGRLTAFTPGAKQQVYHFGRVSLTGEDIMAAAIRIGVPPFLSSSIRRRAGKGELLIRERRPRRITSRALEDTIVRKKAYKHLRDYNNSDRLKQAAVMSGFTGKRTKTGADIEDTRPGRLRRSIHSDNANEGNVIRYVVKADAPYARYVEFPTSRTAAQPFLLPALKNARSRMIKRVGGKI